MERFDCAIGQIRDPVSKITGFFCPQNWTFMAKVLYCGIVNQKGEKMKRREIILGWGPGMVDPYEYFKKLLREQALNEAKVYMDDDDKVLEMVMDIEEMEGKVDMMKDEVKKLRKDYLSGKREIAKSWGVCQQAEDEWKSVLNKIESLKREVNRQNGYRKTLGLEETGFSYSLKF